MENIYTARMESIVEDNSLEAVTQQFVEQHSKIESEHLDINDIIYHCEWEKEMDLKVDFSKPGAISLDFICLATCLKSPSLQDTG